MTQAEGMRKGLDLLFLRVTHGDSNSGTLDKILSWLPTFYDKHDTQVILCEYHAADLHAHL